ncbi:MAG TPA: hypothetical protein PLD25_17330 [Chloroflexota bacterium]|nr:hypothetical protein [Chloroflexota bacterium]HUM70180.1 hypothetical protein [Chloroflexota bacterium]
MTKPGNIILLNGTSSAGKSTIAQALQRVMDEPYLHTGVDHFQLALPPGLVNIKGDLAAEPVGWEVVYGDDGLHSVRIGPIGHQLITGLYRMIAALSESGINLIVDDVIWQEWILHTAVTILHPYPVYFIAIDLSQEVAEQRERQRGDRGPGNVRYFYPHVYELNDMYDVRIDAEANDSERCAQLIKTAVATIHPIAFERLYQTLR